MKNGKRKKHHYLNYRDIVRLYLLTNKGRVVNFHLMNRHTKIRVLGVGESYYHVMSRITERRFYLGSQEKERFREMMRRVAGFCGVEVLTYTVMDNHFHLLIKIPKAIDITDEELLRRMRLIYSWQEVRALEEQLEEAHCADDDTEVRRLRRAYLYRMYNLAEFMKTLKQRYAIWYNRTHGRMGHLWDDRYRSVLVEGNGGSLGRPGALWVMAQYIELNAVRAGIVESAGAYRWCGLGEALAGNKEAQRGICALCGAGFNWEVVRRLYDRDMVEEGCTEAWPLLAGMLGTHRIRYFVDGVMLGTAAFVENMFMKRRSLFCESRQTAARKMKGGRWEGLCTIRDFRTRVIECSGA